MVPCPPVDIAESFIQPPGAGVVDADAQEEPVVAEPAGGGLGRPDQGRADSPPPQRPYHLQVAELRHAGQAPADLGILGRLPRQEPVADRAAVQPGDQQHPATVVLASQVVGEVVALPEGCRERVKVGDGP